MLGDEIEALSAKGRNMNIINKSVRELIPYERNNKKHDQKQIDNVAESIRQFGFTQPLVVDKNNIVVIGHCRLMAAKQLGMIEVPCICVDELSDEQVRKLRIVDNKTQSHDYDMEMLKLELPDLDMGDFDFDFGFDWQSELEDLQDEDNKVNERERTYELYNLRYNNLAETEGKYNMPIIRKDDIEPPKRAIGFNYVLSTKNEEDKRVAVHCFLDDYQIERLWNSPATYCATLADFDCVFTPDYSLYSDMPIAMQIWNTYRNRLVGQIMQNYGISVIPTVSWGREGTFEFAFDGVEKGCICAISTLGVKRDEDSMKMWKAGVDEMIRRIQPSAVWCYGGEVEYNWGDTHVVFFKNEVIERERNGR